MEVSVNASFTSFSSLGSGTSAGELESDLGREALREICCSSLSRILDLADNKLEILLGVDEDGSSKDESAGINVAKNIANKLKSISHRLKFDDHISDVQSSDGSTFPIMTFGSSITPDSQSVFLQLLSHMEMFTSEEGIFRKPGSHSRIEQLVHDLGTHPFHSVVSNDMYTPHDYASVLKLFFNELPEPLMLNRHLEAYAQASEVKCDITRTLCLQLLILLLPPTHHMILSNLLQFLSIISHTEESKMNAHNLSVVFAPTLFFDTKCGDTIIPELIPKMVSLLQYMIRHSVEIFEIPTEVRIVAEKYMKRRTTYSDDVPVDMYASSCQQVSMSSDQFHDKGKEMAITELASLYEYVCKMSDGPQKQHFLKKFGSSSKMSCTSSPYIKKKKSKENFTTPKLKLSKGIGSYHITTPMRPLFNKGSKKLDTRTKSIHVYGTPLKTKANLMEYQRLETDV